MRARFQSLITRCLTITAAAPWLMGQAMPETDAMRRILLAHNAARAEVGSPALAWAPDLASEAQAWAQHIAAIGDMLHGVGATGASGQGENLWAGTSRLFTPEEMVAGWMEEKRFFRPGRFPDNSMDGDWKTVGHYTQIIWRATSEMGCGVADNGREEYLVCRYRTPGNVLGQMPF